MTMQQHIRRVILRSIVPAALVIPLVGCSQALQRRVEVTQPSGADPALDDRFGLTADAQDPTERDNELGYGRWKAKPEPVGTGNPKSPTRRGEMWKPMQ